MTLFFNKLLLIPLESAAAYTTCLFSQTYKGACLFNEETIIIPDSRFRPHDSFYPAPFPDIQSVSRIRDLPAQCIREDEIGLLRRSGDIHPGPGWDGTDTGNIMGQLLSCSLPGHPVCISASILKK